MTESESISTVHTLAIAPAQVIKGHGAIRQLPAILGRFGNTPLMIGGERAVRLVKDSLGATATHFATFQGSQECSETTLHQAQQALIQHQADVIVGVGGGKALDLAKLVAHQTHLPIITVPTSAATCAAWTALSNIYSEAGAFSYDVALAQCPNVLLLDYDLIQTAPQQTLVAGIGDALAKWYEASVSSAHLDFTLTISAVQQARVLRDILLQKTMDALHRPGGAAWQEVVDASVLMAGVMGGLGGAQCRTVAAHAVHNGLTHIPASHGTLHGEKVAYGILVQLRLEELIQQNQLASTARQQLLDFYAQTGLPRNLAELGLGQMTLQELRTAAEVACLPNSDIHRLPFTVTLDQLMAAMVSTQAGDRRASRDTAEPNPSPARTCEGNE